MAAFKSLCKRKSYTAAANELGISQSYLSKLIKKLEDNYGVELVAKKNNEIILTVAGEELYDSCRFILSEYKRLGQKLRRMGNSKGKTIVVGFFYNVLELVNMNQGVAPIPSTLDISNYENVKTISLLPEEPCPFSVAARKGEQPESVKAFIEFCTSLKDKR